MANNQKKKRVDEELIVYLQITNLIQLDSKVFCLKTNQILINYLENLKVNLITRIKTSFFCYFVYKSYKVFLIFEVILNQ